jgi:hypothetical protein
MTNEKQLSLAQYELLLEKQSVADLQRSVPMKWVRRPSKSYAQAHAES